MDMATTTHHKEPAMTTTDDLVWTVDESGSRRAVGNGIVYEVSPVRYRNLRRWQVVRDRQYGWIGDFTLAQAVSAVQEDYSLRLEEVAA